MNSSTPFMKLGALALAVTTLVSLSACGGGGGGDSSSAAGAATTSSYSGTISGLGSIVVNGVRFSTTGARTADEDNPDQPFTKAFALGTTVTVTGTVNADGSTGSATSVVVHGGVRGKVTAVDVANSRFTVAGQTIVVDADTVYDGTTAGFGLTTLVAGTSFVEVYGVYDSATQTVKATRVEEETNAGVAALGFAFKGQVRNLDSTGHTFDVALRSGVTAHVSYADANVKPTGNTLVNGADVRVLVTQSDADALAAASSGTVNVTASKVLLKRDKQADGIVSKLQGAVTSVSSDGLSWTIGDVTVDVSQNPELEGFASLGSVTVGTVVKVKGRFSNGVLVARSIESDSHERDQADGGVKLFGAVTTVDNVNSPNTFVVQGVTVAMGANTLGTLPTVGSYVEVLAKQVNGVLTAVRVSTPSGTQAARAFEVYGTAPCTAGTADLRGSFTLALRSGTLAVDGSAATIETGRDVDMSAADTTKQCVLEVKGTMDTVNSVRTLKATVIEVLKRATSVTLR
jgi:hypothetical protein